MMRICSKELKKLEGSSKTSLINVLGKPRVKKQANSYVIDLSKYKGKLGDVYSQIPRIYGSNYYRHVSNIIVINDNKIQKIYMRK